MSYYEKKITKHLLQKTSKMDVMNGHKVNFDLEECSRNWSNQHPGGTPILGQTRDVQPEWISLRGQKPADGCTFLPKNLRMGHNFKTKPLDW